MAVRIDEAGQNDLALGVDHLFRRTRQNIFLHGGDAAAPDRDVHHAVDAGRGADHLTAADDDVEGRIVNHVRGPFSVSQRVWKTRQYADVFHECFSKARASRSRLQWFKFFVGAKSLPL
jgi:hypothetical protein